MVNKSLCQNGGKRSFGRIFTNQWLVIKLDLKFTLTQENLKQAWNNGALNYKKHNDATKKRAALLNEFRKVVMVQD